MILPASKTSTIATFPPLVTAAVVKEHLSNGKRRRIERHVVITESPRAAGNMYSSRFGFDSLMVDVLVNVMVHLSLDDQDSLAILSKVCQKARHHPSLDATRTGTIVLRGATHRAGHQLWTAKFLMEELRFQGWHKSFGGNRRRLKVSGLEHVRSSKMGDVHRLARWIDWGHVTTLDLSYDAQKVEPRNRKVKNSVVKAFALILPNLCELDLSHMKVTETAINTFAKHCHDLEIFRWRGSEDGFRITGENLAHCLRLKEIDVEGSQLYCSIPRNDTTPEVYDPKSEAFLQVLQLFHYCPSDQLQRVNIKGCKWYSWDVIMGGDSCGARTPLVDIPVEAMVRFVANTPSLRRFESDLPTETVVELQQRYPYVTFC